MKKKTYKIILFTLIHFILIAIPVISQNMVLVEGGTFQMGSNSGDDSEKPVHDVLINSFYISNHEVTQREWEDIMSDNNSQYKNENLPVQNINWDEAVQYCNLRSSREGLNKCYSFEEKNGQIKCDWNMNGYRLPTEAEWEYSARGGKKSQKKIYSGSNEIDIVSWYFSSIGDTVHNVMTKTPNELGLYDMSGNVWEWCWDWFGKYSDKLQKNPVGAISGTHRIIRGGAWDEEENCCSVSYREGADPSFKSDNIGFRIVRTTVSSTEGKVLQPSLSVNIYLRTKSNLRLHEMPVASKTIIKTMQKGTLVKILEIGDVEIIDGIQSNWVRVEIQPESKDKEGNTIQLGTIGWCFGGYLE